PSLLGNRQHLAHDPLAGMAWARRRGGGAERPSRGTAREKQVDDPWGDRRSGRVSAVLICLDGPFGDATGGLATAQSAVSVIKPTDYAGACHRAAPCSDPLGSIHPWAG